MSDTSPAERSVPAVTADAAVPVPVTRTSVATDVALVATFAAFVAVCAVLPAIPTGGAVPITLQTFGVVLTGLVLGPRRGTLALLLYVAVGLAGLPVFSGGAGGLGVLGGASAGYLLAFPAAAAIAGGLGLLARRARPAWRVPALPPCSPCTRWASRSWAGGWACRPRRPSRPARCSCPAT
jgi:biotin transport system substrate-specific component